MKNRNEYYKQYYQKHKKEIYAKVKKGREKQKYNNISLNEAEKYSNLLHHSVNNEIESFDNKSLINMEIKYKIEIPLHESDLMKINEILLNTPYQKNEALAIGCGYYILKLDMTQLTYILNYFLKKEQRQNEN